MSFIKDKVVIITGGSSGIGKACAYRFGKEGGRICISGRNAQNLQDAAKELETAGVEVMTVTGDVSNNRLSVLQEDWDGSAWVNFHRYTFTYDSNNNQLSRLDEHWNGNNWTTDKDIASTYDANSFKESNASRLWDASNVVTEGDSVHYYFHTVTGINEQNGAAAMLAYPNPSNGMFQIKAAGKAEIRVFDALGKLITERRTSGNTTIDLSTQPTGIYILKISSNRGQFTQKLINQ